MSLAITIRYRTTTSSWTNIGVTDIHVEFVMVVRNLWQHELCRVRFLDVISARQIQGTRRQYYYLISLHLHYIFPYSWWCGTVVERRSLAGELSLSCARPAADG